MIKIINSDDVDVIIDEQMDPDKKKYHRQRYNECLQEMLIEIDNIGDPKIQEIFDRYDLSFSIKGDIPMVCIEFPEVRNG